MLFLALVAGALLFSQVAAHAATLTVINTSDNATFSLRALIAASAAGDTINFNIPTTDPGYSATTGVFTITLTSGELAISRDLTIIGRTNAKIAVSGNNASRVFTITAGNVTISGLTIANGKTSGIGGGILNQSSGVVTVTGCTVSGNSSDNDGGGIHNLGTMNLTNSTISGNSATGTDGGGISNNGTMTITNSTLFGNSVSNASFPSNGGGIANFNSGTVNLTNSTISGNSASAGGPFHGNGGGIDNKGTVNVSNTIIAKNTDTGGARDFAGTLTSQGYNLIGNNSGASITPTTGDQIGTAASPIDPVLGLLTDNGGPTFTQALGSGSPAINKGNSSGSNTDQRGFPRPAGLPNGIGDGGDIGAYEVQASQLPGCGNTIVSNNLDDGSSGSLRTIIANACPGSIITFASSVVSPINLTSGELLINKPLTINGPGANLLTVQRGAGNFRILHLASGNFNVTLSGLTIANGNAVGFRGGFGGGIFNQSTGILAVTNCTVSGNSAAIVGGGIYNSIDATNENSTANITNSTLSGNSAGNDGGGIYNAGAANITNSTLFGNSAIGFSGGGIFNSGGTSITNGATVNITNSTIVRNIASGTGNEGGGGIFNNGGTLNAKNTIIALNTAPNVPASGGPDVRGALTSQDFNLIGINSGAAITPTFYSDQVGTAGAPKDPGLDTQLADNGGPTQTLALLSGSRAIDKGGAATDPVTGNPITTDQRGFTRPVDNPAITNAADTGANGSDIGAFEVQATDIIFRNGFEP